jgi:hypothetical protein
MPECLVLLPKTRPRRVPGERTSLPVLKFKKLFEYFTNQLKLLGFPISEEYGELLEHIVQINLPDPAHQRGGKSSGSKPNTRRSSHNAIFRIMIQIMMMAMAIRNLPNFHVALMTTVWRRHQNETYLVWIIERLLSS